LLERIQDVEKKEMENVKLVPNIETKLKDVEQGRKLVEEEV
jgi:hypothetical protein